MDDTQGTKVVVTCHYGLKLGRPNYSSEDTSMSISMEFMSTEGGAEMLTSAGKMEDAIMSALKVAVCTELGVETKVNDAGVLVPNLASAAVAPPVAVPTAPQAVPVATGQPQASGAGDFGPPKASKEQVAVLPRFQADFGKGLATYIDQRSLKAQGLYSAKAPDFKNATDNNDVHWLVGPNGYPNMQVQTALAAAAQAAASPAEAPF